MLAPRKSTPDGIPDNVLLIIGKLLEATKAASDGLKAVSVEVQSNARAVIAASTTLKTVEAHVEQLDEIIRKPGSGLVADVGSASANLLSLTTGVSELRDQVNETVAALREAIDALKHDVDALTTTTAAVRGDVKSHRAAAVAVAKAVAWMATTVIAIYAAVNGK